MEEQIPNTEESPQVPMSTPVLGGQPTQTQPFMQTQVVYETKSSLPVVVGIFYAIYQILPILAGLGFLLGGAFFGGLGAEYDDSEATGIGAIMAGVGLFFLILGSVGIWSGVLIAQRKKLGVHLAWGTLGLGVVLSLIVTTLLETTPDIFTFACNGICALFVGLPLMISSASQHME